MKAEQPAEGILKRNDWGNSKWYQVVCGCGQEYHDHNVWIEADETGINVTIHTTVKTDYWTETFKPRYDIDSEWLQSIDWYWKSTVNNFINKVKITWELWTTGAITTETSIALTEQQALNYAETLKSAIQDVKKFQAARKAKVDIQNKIAKKLAEESDCV